MVEPVLDPTTETDNTTTETDNQTTETDNATTETDDSSLIVDQPSTGSDAVVYMFNEYSYEEIASSYFTVFGAIIFVSCFLFLVMRAIIGRRSA